MMISKIQQKKQKISRDNLRIMVT